MCEFEAGNTDDNRGMMMFKNEGISQCQTPKSAAKNRPARISSFHSADAVAVPFRSAARTQSQSSGTANAMRQNALAAGLVSEILTKIGAKAVAAAPRRSAATARGLLDNMCFDAGCMFGLLVKVRQPNGSL